MNYFELYPGDYLRDTAELTLAEHGAFLLLLSAYYATERAIPSDNPTLFRLVRAMTIDEQNAVSRVSELFFPISTVDGLRHNKRADEEIVKARARIDAARENGRHGGRPKKPSNNPVGSNQQTHWEPDGVPSSKAPHTPHATQEKSTLSVSTDGIDEKSVAQAKQRIPESEILSAYHEHLPMLTAVRKMNDTRKRKLKARWCEDVERQTPEYWDKFFAYVAKSDFLTGRNGQWTACDFEWLIEDSNHLKVIEGKYENREAA